MVIKRCFYHNQLSGSELEWFNDAKAQLGYQDDVDLDNLISLWQTINNTEDLPTVEELNSYKFIIDTGINPDVATKAMMQNPKNTVRFLDEHRQEVTVNEVSVGGINMPREDAQELIDLAQALINHDNGAEMVLYPYSEYKQSMEQSYDHEYSLERLREDIDDYMIVQTDEGMQYDKPNKGYRMTEDHVRLMRFIAKYPQAYDWINNMLEFNDDVIEQAKFVLPMTTFIYDDRQQEMSFDTTVRQLNQERQLLATFSSKEIQERSFRIARIYSDVISQIVKDLPEEQKAHSAYENRQNVIKNTRNVDVVDMVKKRIRDEYCDEQYVREYLGDLIDDEHLEEAVKYRVSQGQKMLANFDALFLHAYAELKEYEPLDATIFEADDDPANIEEETSKHDEGWLDEVHSKSVEKSMDREIKFILSDIYAVDEEGFYTQYDSLFDPIPIPFRNIHGTLLHNISKTVYDKDMIPRLQAMTAKYGWVQQVLDVMLGNNTIGVEEDGQFYPNENLQASKVFDGLDDDEKLAKTISLQARLWNSYHKIHVLMTQQDNEGNIEVLNESEGKSAALNNFRYNIVNGFPLYYEGQRVPAIYDRFGHFNRDNYNTVKTWWLNGNWFMVLSKGKLNDDQIARLNQMLKCIGVDYSNDVIKHIVNDHKNAKQNRGTIKDVFAGLFKSEDQGNEPLKDITRAKAPASIFNAFNKHYDALAEMFADDTIAQEESSATFNLNNGERKRLFSHIYPNHIHTLFGLINNIDDADYQTYTQRLQKEFLYNWWYMKDGRIRNSLLRLAYDNPKARKEIKLMMHTNSHGETYSEEQKLSAEITKLNYFFNGKTNVGDVTFTKYITPAFSDTSTAYYLNHPYYNLQNNMETIMENLRDIFMQELDRIQVVTERANKRAQGQNIEPLEAYDVVLGKDSDGNATIKSIGGAEFKFFKKMSDVDRILDDINELSSDSARQKEYIDRLILQDMEEEFRDYLDALSRFRISNHASSPYRLDMTYRQPIVAILSDFLSGRDDLDEYTKATIRGYINDLNTKYMDDVMFEGYKQNIISLLSEYEIPKEQMETVISAKNNTVQIEQLRDFFYNNFIANTNIIELTMVDPAFLGSEDKFQKRYKQFYSPVQTCYTSHYMYDDQNNIVVKNDLTQQYEHSISLVDYEIERSLSYDNLRAAMSKELAKRGITHDAFEEIMKGQEGIELSDAQCYRTLPSWKKCLYMTGQGDNPRAMKAFERMENGTWDGSDYFVLIEIFKGFVSAHSNVDANVDMGDDQFNFIKYPTQHKNSEFPLLAIYAKLSGVVKKSPKLRALNQFMVDHGIDKAQFKTAIKVGNHGAIDINHCKTDKEVREILESATGLTGNMQASDSFSYNDDGTEQLKVAPGRGVIHRIPMDRWGISTKMPEHMLTHGKSSIGTQLMKIIMEDIPDDAVINVGGRSMTKKQVIAIYQAIFTANLAKQFNKVYPKLTTPAKLAEFLKEQIKVRDYSQDLIKHLEIDENGSFKYPLIDPILKSEFESMCSSLIRKDITKQYIKSASLPQVSCWGIEDKLSMRYQDNSGNMILYEDEFNRILDKKGSYTITVENPTAMNEADRFETLEFTSWPQYKRYAESATTSVKHMEVAMPIYDKNLLDMFVDKETGYVDEIGLNKLLKRFPKLAEGIGYRIPTEAKHSMCPFKIKYFLPSQNSSCAMIPAEWIAISDSDNDGDKLYCLFYENTFVTMSEDEIEQEYIMALQSREINPDMTLADYKKAMKHTFIKGVKPVSFKLRRDTERNDGESDEAFLIRQYVEAIDDNKLNSQAAVNNLFVDIIKGILQCSDNAKHIMKSGGFPGAKSSSAKIAALQNPDNNFESIDDYERLINMSGAKNIKAMYPSMDGKYGINNPAWRTLIQIRNMAGRGLISVYANFRSFRSLIELAKLTINGEKIAINNNISLNQPNSKRIDMSVMVNNLGQYVSDNIGNFSGASVDNAKEPLLDLLGQNAITAPISMLMLNMGYSIDDVAFFMTQPVIMDLLEDYQLGNNGMSLATMIDKKIDYLKSFIKMNAKKDDAKFNRYVSESVGLPMWMLAEQIHKNAISAPVDIYDNVVQLQVLETFKNLMMPSNSLNELNRICRADTQNGTAKSRSGENIKLIQLINRIRADIKASRFPIKNANILVGQDTKKLLTASTKDDVIDMPMVRAYRYYTIELVPSMLRNVSFAYNNVISNLLQEYLDKSGSKAISAAEIDSIVHSCIQYLMSTIKAFNMYNDNNKVIPGNEYRNTVVNGLPIVVNYIKHATPAPNDTTMQMLQNNVLIKSLISDMRGAPWTRYMRNVQVRTEDKRNRAMADNLRIGWAELFDNKDKKFNIRLGNLNQEYSVGELALELLQYCVIANGFEQNNISFINAFPFDRLEDIPGYDKAMIALLRFSNTGHIDYMIDQYVANNPATASIVHKVNSDRFYGFVLNQRGAENNSILIPTRIHVDPGTKNINVLDLLTKEEPIGFGATHSVNYPYIYIRSQEDNEQIPTQVLYKGRMEGDVVVYERMSILGNPGFIQEYEYGKDTRYNGGPSSIRSIVEYNNPSTSVAIVNNILSGGFKSEEIDQDVLDNAIREFVEGLVTDRDKTISYSVNGVDFEKYNPATKDLTGVEYCVTVK